ncbi:hypothetical protein PKHYL_35420 [Psychrobacter sp. KH172YL61]|nr:hypothetical protein PKHYL_35420 [Psychrobacter sp. KH172YL61]
MLTHGNLIANLIQCNMLLGDEFDEFERKNEQPVIMTALPLYHIFSFTVCGMFGLYRGCIGLLVPNPRDLPSLIKAYKDYPPAFFPAVNTLFTALANNAEFKSLDHSKLVSSMGGGMAVLGSTAEQWQQVTGNVISQGYGLSETAPVATATPWVAPFLMVRLVYQYLAPMLRSWMKKAMKWPWVSVVRLVFVVRR